MTYRRLVISGIMAFFLWMVFSCSSNHKMQNIFRRLDEIKRETPTPKHFDDLADIKRAIDRMKGTPLQLGLPKSFGLALAVYGMQMQRTYQSFPTSLPKDIKADDLCDQTMAYLDRFEDTDYMPADYPLLKKQGSRFGLDVTDLTADYVDKIRTEVANNLCPEPDPCAPPTCPESYSDDGANKDLYKLFKVIVKPSTINLSTGKIEADSQSINNLIADLERIKDNHGITSGYDSSKWSNLIYALSKSLLYKARFLHAMDDDFTPVGEPRLRERTIGRCEEVVAVLDQVKARCDEVDELCSAENLIGRCMLLDLAPEISEDQLLPWINKEIDIINDLCHRDTCLDSKAYNFYNKGVYYGYRDNPDLCVFCGCTDTMYVEGKIFMEKYGDRKIISEPDSCRMGRGGCKLECDPNYCADCDIADNTECANKNLCGCLDATAVNWAHDTLFNSNSNYYKHWVNLSISKNDTSICLYTGCTDSTALNYHPRAIASDGSCEYREGCMDPCAANYDSLAIRDNGTCEVTCGCTYPAASNYNPAATSDDGSCHFKSNTPSTQLKKFTEFLEAKGLSKVKEFVDTAVLFRNCGDDKNCLRIQIDANGVNMDVKQYPLGHYTNGIADEFVRRLMEFYNSVSDDRKCFERSDIEFICVGTADAHPINRPGILYKGEIGKINTSYFCLPSDFLVDQDRLKSLPNGRTQIPRLSSGSYIRTNCELAAVRAFVVADPIIAYYKDPVLAGANKVDITIGGKAFEEEEGGEYRGVMFRLDLPRFFSCVSVEPTEKEDPVKRAVYEVFLEDVKCKCE